MRMKAKRISLVVCLFLFLFVVIGKCVAPQSGRSFSCSGYRHAVADLRFQSALSRNNCERTGQFLRGAVRADGRDRGHGDRSADWRTNLPAGSSLV